MKIRGAFLMPYALLMGLMFTSCQSAESRRKAEKERLEQERILEEEQRQEAYRDCMVKTLNHYIGIVNENDGQYSPGRYAAAFEGLSLSGCPEDFSTAFISHIEACKEAQEIINARETLNSDENAGTVLAESLLSTISGSETTPFMDAVRADIQLKKLSEEANEKVQSTLGLIERVAKQYGIEL